MLLDLVCSVGSRNQMERERIERIERKQRIKQRKNAGNQGRLKQRSGEK
jgi:hypothetical protein